jgi:hypothetical protein
MRGTPDVIEGERFRTRGSRGPVISPQFTERQLSHDLEIGVHDADDCSSRNCGQLANIAISLINPNWGFECNRLFLSIFWNCGGLGVSYWP